jgi:hypothetical protein
MTAVSNNLPLIEGPWKKLRVLPQQTVLETAAFDFPEVQKPTAYLLNFYNGRNALGLMFLHVYPTNLLRELKSLAGDVPLGLLEPENIFKPLFRTNGINFSDLEKTDLEHFNGSLAIFGSLHGTIGLPYVFTSKIPDMAKRGVGIVWIQPRGRQSEPM